MDEDESKRVMEPTRTEAAIVTAGDDDVFDRECSNVDNAEEVVVVSNVENSNADKCNPYPRIIEGTADDEQCKCKEPEIVKFSRSLILNKRPQMKSEFSKCICLACDGDNNMSPKFYWLSIAQEQSKALLSVLSGLSIYWNVPGINSEMTEIVDQSSKEMVYHLMEN
jgi:hypothetical protein